MKTCKKVYITPRGEVSSPAADATALEFRFTNGTTRRIVIKDLGSNIVTAAAWHGISQKCGDAFAASLNVSEAVQSFDDTLAQLRGGDWNTKATGGGNSRLVAAVAEVRKITPEAAAAAIAKLPEDKVAALRKHPAIREAIARQEAARLSAAAKGTKDTLDSLLG